MQIARGVFLLLTVTATWRYTVLQAQIKLNVPYSWVFCLTVRAAYWCSPNTVVFLLVQLPLTESQSETHHLLWTATDLAVEVATVCWSGQATVRWTGNELVLSVSWNVILNK